MEFELIVAELNNKMIQNAGLFFYKKTTTLLEPSFQIMGGSHVCFHRMPLIEQWLQVSATPFYIYSYPPLWVTNPRGSGPGRAPSGPSKKRQVDLIEGGIW